MSVGKYVTDPGVIGAAFSAVAATRQSGRMRRDWRRLLVWGVWGLGLALAIAGVAMREQDEAFAMEQEDEKARAKREKAELKAARKALK